MQCMRFAATAPCRCDKGLTWSAAHVEFTRDGKYAPLSSWDMDRAVVSDHAKTLEEVKRIPMKKPSGKNNVWNKIFLKRGTSR